MRVRRLAEVRGDGNERWFEPAVDRLRALPRDADARLRDFLAIQEKEARWWRDATLQYFQTFSRRPIPAGYEEPARPLEFYRTLRCPPDRDKPRCEVLP